MNIISDPALITAWAAMVGAIAAVIGAIGTFRNGRAALINREIGKQAVAASVANSAALRHVTAQVTAVDAKVDGVAEQTNGHMTSLIAAVAPVDPALATAAAVRIVENAEKVAETLRSCDKKVV